MTNKINELLNEYYSRIDKLNKELLDTTDLVSQALIYKELGLCYQFANQLLLLKGN